MKCILFNFQAWLLCLPLSAQTNNFNKAYVDFHIHTNLKNYYRNILSPDVANALSSDNQINWQHFAPKKADGLGFNNIKSPDQGTYTILEAAHASIICSSIYTLEKQSVSKRFLPVSGLIQPNWLRFPFKYTILFPFDHLFSMRWINKIAVTGIDRSRQRTAYKKENSNFSEFRAQLHFMESQSTATGRYKPIQLAGKDDNLNDTSRIWLVLTAEGAHNFYGPLISGIKEITDFRTSIEQEDELIRNLDSIKNEYRLFFVTPAHLFENKVAGGATGLDIDKSLFRKILSILMWDKRFSVVDKKSIEGINAVYIKNKVKRSSDCDCEHTDDPPEQVSTGWRFIHELLQPNNCGRRTFVDMRHMDVKARTEIIDTIKAMNKNLSEDEKIPLIVSHAAVSGKSQKMAAFFGLCPFYDDYREFTQTKIRNYYKRICRSCALKTGLPGDSVDSYLQNAGWFHPMSNNLFDEEIQAVYQTGGIIGITLEERALGWKGYNYAQNQPTKNLLKRYLSTHFDSNQLSIGAALRDSLLNAEPFVRNLFYIVEHSGYNDIRSWRQIALGSDFDGMMNPIDICPDATAIPNFYKFLCNHLDLYADYMQKTPLLFGQQPSVLMDMLFFRNGENFIREHF